MRRFRPILVVLLLIAVAGLAEPGRPNPSSDPVLRQYLQRQGFNWKSKETEHFHLFFEPDSHADRHMSDIKRNVEMDRATVLHLIGVRNYTPTIYAFFLQSGEQMKELIGVEVNGRSRPVQHAVFSVITPQRLHLTHELCHEIVSNLWGAAEPWIEEGLATYAAEGANLDYESWTLLQSGSLIPLEQLVSKDWTSTRYSADVTYPELGAFVKYLHDAYGVERLKKAWQHGSGGVASIYGKPLAELEKEWRESMERYFPEKPEVHYRSGDAGFWMD
jgi:hypothetical protein